MAAIARVRTVISGWQGGPGLDTFYFNPGTAGGSTADAVDICARVRAFWLACAANYSVSLGFQVSGSVDMVDPLTGILNGGFSGGSPAGTAGSGSSFNLLPTESAIGMRLQTGVILAGRRLVGRKFMSPCVTGLNVNGVPTAAGGNLFITAAGSLTSGSTTSQLVAWHRPKAHTGGLAVPVTGFSIAPTFWSLRSRRD